MIEEKDVKHIAKLARINISTQELKDFQKELDSILDYFKKLDEVKIPKTIPQEHVGDLKNVLRDDAVFTTDASKITDLIPRKEEGFIKVKSIL